MVRIDWETGNKVGNGEDTAYIILKEMFNLEHKFHHDWPKDGIYTQVPLTWILNVKFLQDLAPWHRKGSLDLLIMKNNKPIAIRVQGWSHFGGKKKKKHGINEGLKSQRDEVQKWMLLESNVPVIDFDCREMPELFNNKLSDKSRKEVDYFMKMWLLAHISYLIHKFRIFT